MRYILLLITIITMNTIGSSWTEIENTLEYSSHDAANKKVTYEDGTITYVKDGDGTTQDTFKIFFTNGEVTYVDQTGTGLFISGETNIEVESLSYNLPITMEMTVYNSNDETTTYTYSSTFTGVFDTTVVSNLRTAMESFGEHNSFTSEEDLNTYISNIDSAAKSCSNKNLDQLSARVYKNGTKTNYTVSIATSFKKTGETEGESINILKFCED